MKPVLLCLVVIAAFLGWSRFGDTQTDPRVAGRRLSGWFREAVREPTIWTMVEQQPGALVFGGPTMGMAVTVFEHSGNRAAPFFADELLRSSRDSPLAEFLEEMNRRLPPSMKLPGLEREERVGAALGLLERARVPLADLEPALEPLLTSSQPWVRGVGIRALGCARDESGAVVRRILPYLRSADTREVRSALKALERHGESAVLAVEDLLRLHEAKLVMPALRSLLGACGPMAERALPGLEAEWRTATDGNTRVELALILCRIRPGHPEAWPFLEAIARGERRSMPDRIQPMQVARGILRLRVRDPQFVPLLQEILRKETNDLRNPLEITRSIQWADPGVVDRYLRGVAEGLQATNRILATMVMSRLLAYQPTNTFARDALVRECAAAEDSADIVKLWAFRSLCACGDLTPELRQSMETWANDATRHETIGKELRGYVRWVKLRETLAAERSGFSVSP